MGTQIAMWLICCEHHSGTSHVRRNQSQFRVGFPVFYEGKFENAWCLVCRMAVSYCFFHGLVSAGTLGGCAPPFPHKKEIPSNTSNLWLLLVKYDVQVPQSWQQLHAQLICFCFEVWEDFTLCLIPQLDFTIIVFNDRLAIHYERIIVHYIFHAKRNNCYLFHFVLIRG